MEQTIFKYLPSDGYICKKCGKTHQLYQLRLEDNGWDYTYSCSNCGDIMESNFVNYWQK
jgi:DNA-directed RNA polymerase subunit RPC12/RpoP